MYSLFRCAVPVKYTQTSSAHQTIYCIWRCVSLRPFPMQVRGKLRDAKAKLKEIVSQPAAAAQPKQTVSTSAASSAAGFTQRPVSMPAGIAAGQIPPAFRAGPPPPPPPPRASNNGLAQNTGSGDVGPDPDQARPGQAGRPYSQPYLPPASNFMTGSGREAYHQYPAQQGGREPYQHPFSQQGSPQQPYRQLYDQQGHPLEPYRPPYGYGGAQQPGRGGPAGGRGMGQPVKLAGRGPHQQHYLDRGAASGALAPSDLSTICRGSLTCLNVSHPTPLLLGYQYPVTHPLILSVLCSSTGCSPRQCCTAYVCCGGIRMHSCWSCEQSC